MFTLLLRMNYGPIKFLVDAGCYSYPWFWRAWILPKDLIFGLTLLLVYGRCLRECRGFSPRLWCLWKSERIRIISDASVVSNSRCVIGRWESSPWLETTTLKAFECRGFCWNRDSSLTSPCEKRVPWRYLLAVKARDIVPFFKVDECSVVPRPSMELPPAVEWFLQLSPSLVLTLIETSVPDSSIMKFALVCCR